MAICGGWARLLVLVTAVSAATACSSDAPERPPATPEHGLRPLVSFDAWNSLPRSSDPFVDDPALAPDCVGPGFRVEPDEQRLEIDTGLCNWVTIEQAARLPVATGQRVQLEFSHYDLDAPAPAQAEVRLRFEDCAAWSKTIPIPSAAEALVVPFDSPCALAAGSRVLFHLHNHGQNTYQLSALLVLR